MKKHASPSKGLYWVIAAVVGGAASVYAYVKTSGSPSGKRWPGGITSEQAMQAVQIALNKESNPIKLKAFASALERYDIHSTRLLRAKAHEIELIERGIFRKIDPTRKTPMRGASA